jgi:hypothetical protein
MTTRYNATRIKDTWIAMSINVDKETNKDLELNRSHHKWAPCQIHPMKIHLEKQLRCPGPKNNNQQRPVVQKNQQKSLYRTSPRKKRSLLTRETKFPWDTNRLEVQTHFPSPPAPVRPA